MKTSRGLVLFLILVALAVMANSQFWNKNVPLTHLGTPVSVMPKPLAEENGLTEEAWTIMEVCDQIVFLLHPEWLNQSATTNRIKAERRHSEPVSYTVEEGRTKSTVTLNSPVWDPATYQVWCKAVSGEGAAPIAAPRADILTDLLTPDTGTFLALDARLSAELAKNPRQPEICTDAALLLGTMAWLDGAGYFQDVRSLLNRMTAFIAVGDALGARGRNREVAEILRLVLIHDQVEALRKIAAARSGTGSLPKVWLDALEVTATGDWRKTEPVAATGPLLLQLSHFHVLAQNMGANKAEAFLRTLAKPAGVSWVRYLTQTQLGIGQGHRYSRSLLGMEVAEADAVAKALGEEPLMNPRDTFAAFVMKFDGRASYERSPQGGERS